MTFEYFEPQNLSEALQLLEKYNDRAKVLAGGTDLIKRIKERKINVDYVINIGNISSLKYIKYINNSGLTIGALTTIREIEKSALILQKYSAISEAAQEIGSVQIRNVGTIGGNLCNASPAADMVPILMSLSAKLKIANTNQEREVDICNFFNKPGKSNTTDAEILTEIMVPQLEPKTGAVYLKLRQRGGEELAIVGIAVVITMNSEINLCSDVKISLGAVAPTTIRARKAEKILKGAKIDQELITRAALIASEESMPITDIRATGEYRKEMVNTLTIKAIEQAIMKSSEK